jgi:hypothetical protein
VQLDLARAGRHLGQLSRTGAPAVPVDVKAVMEYLCGVRIQVLADFDGSRGYNSPSC